ncbi:uncharacterized protein [Euphorbia lathyris]|uniref:uncharacterized protein n=1 Tax=Euphorbia lathyris TaxID=212925 RepID=UPI003313FE56
MHLFTANHTLSSPFINPSMVFPSIAAESEDFPQFTDSESHMASNSTSKPHKPLHNFPLQDLKWSVNHANTSSHRFRRPAGCSRRLLHVISSSDSDRSPVGGDGAKGGRNSVASRNRKAEKLGVSVPVSDSPVGDSGKKTKIYIRLKNKAIKQVKCVGKEAANAGDQHQPQNQPQKKQQEQQEHQPVELDYDEVPMGKTWNLRPRKPARKGSRGNGGGKKVVAALPAQTKATEDAQMGEEKEKEKEKEKGKENEKGKGKEKEKEAKTPNFSIPLTNMEIEEDIFALTGSKPAKKPQKRSKQVQKQLDRLFPGMWLASITRDMYEVIDTPRKI